MNVYVAGFFIDPNKEYVALVLKNTPEWQKGKLNAIGGKIEFGESPFDAMRREFQEETGVLQMDWRRFCLLRGKVNQDIHGADWTVHFFVAYGDPFFCKRKNDVGEEIWIMPISAMMAHDEKREKRPMISNIPWLLQMAMAIEGDKASELVVSEVY